MSDRMTRAKEFLAKIEGHTEGGLESLLASPSQVQELTERAAVPASAKSEVKRTLEKMATSRDLSTREQFVLEAIIIPDRRPAIDIRGGDFQIDHPDWRHFGTGSTKAALRRILPSVGRVEIAGIPGLPYGGTGFVVGTNLLMTNRHVAELFTSGVGRRGLVFRPGLRAGIDFKRERDSNESQYLRVRRVEMIHPFWDMALLSVDGLTDRNPPLVLSLTPPDQLRGRDIAVVGYPGFDPGHPHDVQNHVFGGIYNVKRLMPGKIGVRRNILSFDHSVSALTHDASTLPGASGSAVVDPVNGELVALHFAGAYLDANFTVPAWELAQDVFVIEAGVRFHSRVGGNTALTDRWWGELERAPRLGAIPAPPTPLGVQPGQARGQEATWTIPLQVTVRLGDLAATVAAGPAEPSLGEAAIERAIAPIHDSDYSTRRGYAENFLALPVPLPEPVDDSRCARQENGELVLPYHHFSVVMDKTRRLALFTAANVDAKPRRKKPEPGRSYSRKALGGLGPKDSERWFSDPRLAAEFQLPDRFFTSDRGAFDRGHVVRREDVAWGDSYQEVRFANGDTFHTPNCTPQIAGFNQADKDVDNWGDLENYVSSEIGTDRLSIFAGPVLGASDPYFRGLDDDGPVRIQIPQQYWKIILANEGGVLRAFAFVLRQDLSNTDLEFAVDAHWRGHMISIADLESLLGNVRFDEAVHDADQADRPAGEALRQRGAIELVAT